MKQKLGLLVLKYLRFWARLQLKKFAPDVIGITGSAGKTTCRNAVKAVLQDKYKVKISTKANSESGIPLNILGIKPNDFSPIDWLRMMILAPIKIMTNWKAYEKYVVEMGIDSPLPPKNMDYLLTIVKPRTAIFLNALPVHTAYYGAHDPVGSIAKEKGKLIESLPESGLAVLNIDDERVNLYSSKTKAQVVTFGKKGQVKITGYSVSLEGTIFQFEYEGEKVELKLPYVLPMHFSYSLAAAMVIGIDEDFTLKESCQLLQNNFKLPPSRSTMLSGVNGSVIIDSSYNASMQNTLDMLGLLKMIPGKRKFALLGDMRELGAEANVAHEQVIRKGLTVCDEVFLVGPQMRENTVSPAVWCKSATQAAEIIKPKLKAGDVLLVKGSQNTIFLEAAVNKLLVNREDGVKLCRRGEFWERQRAQL